MESHLSVGIERRSVMHTTMHEGGSVVYTARPAIEDPTAAMYDTLQEAVAHFNGALFDGELPHCLVTLQRKGRGTYGYFCSNRFENAVNGQITDEIALNPRHILRRRPDDTLSTLVHEMVHLWQQHFGKPGRGRYHNRQWAAKMMEIGLQPTSTGQPGGRRTGQKMTHVIMPGGPFDRACAEFLEHGRALTWGDRADYDPSRKAGKRVKYTCPLCGLNAWAKPDAFLVCGECEHRLEGN